jgi:DNA-binding SARP family transcriptional activator/pimeloyl-ACP methyl ester carboxylesterase
MASFHCPPPPTAPLRFRAFGTPAIDDGAGSVRLSLKRGYALLAYLALEGRPVPREHLSALLWPEADASTGRTRLRRLLYQIEDLCGRDLLETHEGNTAIAAGALVCDAAEFREMAQLLVGGGTPCMSLAQLHELAVAACEPFLDGLSIDSEAFDDWLALRRLEHQHLLARTLTRIAEMQRNADALDSAADTAERLLRLDPFCEPAYALRMAICAQAGDAAGVEAQFARCAQALRDEFGSRPSATTEAAYLRCIARASSPAAPGSDDLPPLEVRFAHDPEGSVAYTLIGAGSEALLVMSGFVSHMEIASENPGVRRALAALAQRFTVVLFDRRGLGLSERLNAQGSVSAAARDALTVLDAAGIRKAWLLGASEGGPAAILLAARHADRISGLALFGAMACGIRRDDYPWALRPQDFDRWMQSLIDAWGGPADIETFAPSQAKDPAMRAWWARMLRHAASPASLRAVLRGLREADVRPLLSQVRQPVLVMHRTGDRAVRIGAGEHLARNIAGSRFVALPGDDHFWWVGDADAVVREIVEFTDGASRTGHDT